MASMGSATVQTATVRHPGGQRLSRPARPAMAIQIANQAGNIAAKPRTGAMA